MLIYYIDLLEECCKNDDKNKEKELIKLLKEIRSKDKCITRTTSLIDLHKIAKRSVTFYKLLKKHMSKKSNVNGEETQMGEKMKMEYG